jgi:hypothetical protein
MTLAAFIAAKHQRFGSIPRDLERTYSRYSFSRPEQGAGFFVSAMGGWRPAAELVMDHGNRYLMDPSLGADRAAEEALDLSGFVNWRAAGPGCLSDVDDVVLTSHDQADALRPTFRRIGSENRAAILALGRATCEAIYYGATMPIDHSKGGVTCAAGSVKRIAIATTRIMRSETTRAGRVRAQRGIAAWDTLHATIATLRFQNRKGRRAARHVLRGRLVEFGDVRAPKERQIRIIPFEDQIDLMGLTSILLELDRLIRPNWVGSKDVCRQHKERFRYSFSSDKKAFDDGCTLPALFDHLEFVIRPTLEALADLGVISQADAFRIEDTMRDLHVYDSLLPPLDVHFAARRAASMGTVKSGLGPTNRIDTHFNAGHAESTGAELANATMAVDIYGDDLRVSTNDPDLMEAWAARGADGKRNLGWTELVAPADTFGQEYIIRGAPSQPKPVRLMMSTAQKEMKNEPRSIIEAAVGVRARIDILGTYPRGRAAYMGFLEDAASRSVILRATLGLAISHQQSELGRLLASGGQLAQAARISEWGTAFAAVVTEFRRTSIWDESAFLPREPTIAQLFKAADSLTIREARTIIAAFQARQE